MDTLNIPKVVSGARTLEVHGHSLISDFLNKRFNILVLECNLQCRYEGPLQKPLTNLWPALRTYSTVRKEPPKLGQVDLWRTPSRVYPYQYVANMYVVDRLPVKGEPRLRSHEGFSLDAFRQCFDNLFETLVALGGRDLDRRIAVQRFGGGMNGLAWPEVRNALDFICGKHGVNIYAYLPPKYDRIRTRSSAK